MKLYELTARYKEVQDLIEQEGLSPEQFKNYLGDLQDDINSKCINLGKVYLGLRAEFDAIYEEQKRLADKKQTLQNKMDSIREYLLYQMQEVGMEKAKDAIVTVFVRTNPVSIEIVDQNLIPAEYTHTETFIDKSRILETYKQNGELVAGVKIIDDKKRVDIR